MSKRKKLLIWTSVINFIAVAFFIYSAILLINNIDGFADEMKEMLIQMYGSEEMAVEYLNLCGTYFIMSAIINAVFAVIYIIFASLSAQKYAKFKTWLTVAAIVNVLLGMNIISFVLVLIVIFNTKAEINSYSQPEVININVNEGLASEQIREQLKMRNMTEKIELIKQLKQDGSITEAEYNKLLDEIISEGVK